MEFAVQFAPQSRGKELLEDGAVQVGLKMTNRILTLNDSLFQEAYTYALLSATS